MSYWSGAIGLELLVSRTAGGFEENPSELYERLLVPSKFLPWAANFVDLSELGSGGKILDVAFGTGTVTRLIPPIVGTAGRVAGLDFNAGRLAVAANLPRPAGCDIEWVEGDAGNLPFDSGTFDIVFCQQGLQFFPDKSAALAEMNRVLVTNGKLILGVWRSKEHQPGGNATADTLEHHIGAEAGAIRRAPFAFGDAGVIRSLVTGAGFRNVEVRPTVKKVHFPSAEAFTKRYISARTPLNQMVAAASHEQREAVVNEVNSALAKYETDNGLELPTAVNVVVARA